MRLTDFTGTFVQIIKGKTDSWLIVELDGRVRLSRLIRGCYGVFCPESQARKAALGLMRPASGVRNFPGVVFLKYGGGIFETANYKNTTLFRNIFKNATPIFQKYHTWAY